MHLEPEMSQLQSDISHAIDIFLPDSLVKVVLKLAKKFELSSFNEFSLLDSLQLSLCNQMESGCDMDEKSMVLLVINVIRLTEKFNSAMSRLTQLKVDEVFGELGITNDEFKAHEFEAFKMMNFKFVSPHSFEMVYNLVQTHLTDESKDFLFDLSLDVLRFVYCWRSGIFDV